MDSYKDAMNNIVYETKEIYRRYHNLDYFAPDSVADQMSDADLQALVNVTEFLKNQVDLIDGVNNDLNKGELIILYTLVGAILEGWLHFFYTVHYESYIYERFKYALRKSKSSKVKKCEKCGQRIYEDQDYELLIPMELGLEQLKIISREVGITEDGEEDYFTWIGKIQTRRNAIHIFKKREIGNIREFKSDLVKLNKFIDSIKSRLPLAPEDAY